MEATLSLIDHFCQKQCMFVVLHLKYCLHVAESRIKSPSWTMPLNVNFCLTGRYGNFVQNSLNITGFPEHYENKFPKLQSQGNWQISTQKKTENNISCRGRKLIHFILMSLSPLYLFILGPLLFSFRGSKTGCSFKFKTDLADLKTESHSFHLILRGKSSLIQKSSAQILKAFHMPGITEKVKMT